MTKLEAIRSAIVSRIHHYEDLVDTDSAKIERLTKVNRSPDIIYRKFVSNQAAISECKKRIKVHTDTRKVWVDVLNMVDSIIMSDSDKFNEE